MKHKKILYGIILIGLISALSAFIVKGYGEKTIAGVMFGVGFTIFGLGTSKALQLRFYEKHPEHLEIRSIEEQDERNVIINNKAQASAAKMQQYLIIGLAYVLILADVELYLIVATVMVYLSFTLLTAYFRSFYNKKM